MQYAVPQFTDVEDKLIGPLTLKQFLVVLGFGAILFFLWSILGVSILFYMIAIPLAGVAAYVTLKKFNGRPFFAYFLPLLSFIVAPKVMVFKREGGAVHFTNKEAAKDKTAGPQTAADLEPADSRLKKLSYLLDQDLKKEKAVLDEEIFKAPPKVVTPAAPKPAPKSGPAKFTPGLPKQFNLNPLAKPAPTKNPDSAAPRPTVTESGPVAVQTRKIAPQQTPTNRQFNPDDILRG
jgi:hypothetical protein